MLGGPSFTYWEKQGTDRLCGVHCLNSLLQGPFYTELSLAEIAREIDSQEKALIGEQGVETTDYKKYVAEGSNNVADDGNYNIQVISEALKRTGDLKVDSIDSSMQKDQDLSNETGFICNSAAHWFSIRKVKGKWYNLNSTNRQGPEMISDFYLSAFLHSVRENGYIIFVVQGNYPNYDPTFFGETLPHQRFFTESQCAALHEKNIKKKNYRLNVGGTDERDLEEAMQNSLKEGGGKNRGHDDEEEEDDEDEYERAIKESLKDDGKMEVEEENENKFKAFQGSGVSLGASSNSNKRLWKWDVTEDPELAFVLRMTMEEKFSQCPKPGPDMIELNIRLLSGKVETWLFNKNTDVEELYDFVKTKLSDDHATSKFMVGTTYPKKFLVSMGDSLGALGLENGDMLATTKI